LHAGKSSQDYIKIMSGKTASLIGATGLIGSELLKLLLADPYFETVKVIVRRPFDGDHPKLEKKIVDFNDPDSLLIELENSDVIFCTVGTTQKKVKGDKAAYRKVDHDIPVNAARYCRMTGCRIFVLVSAVGASSSSNNFYLNLKAEVEDAVRKTGIESVHVMRPSMLLGRRDEFRLGERLAKRIMKTFSFLFVGGLKKYRAIDAHDVAKAMLNVSKEMTPGFFVYEYEQMKRSASGHGIRE
jgi:uncharacterized protein YbjT (DUF2867 family)